MENKKRQKTPLQKKREQKYGVQFAATIVIMAALFLTQISLFLFYYRDIDGILSEQVDMDLRETTELSAVFLNHFLRDTQTKLNMAAGLFDVPDGSGNENWREMLEKARGDNYRLGVAGREGKLEYGGGTGEDVSDTGYYQEAMKGKETVSGVLPRHYLGRDSVVIAVPILGEEGRAEGCICLEYSTQYLGSLINKVDTQGLGATLVIDPDGLVAASYPGMEEFDTFYDMLETKNFKGGDSLEELWGLLRSGREGFYQYYFNDRERYLYYQPMELNGWTIITLVMRQSFKANLGEVWKHSWWLLISVLTLSAVFFICLLRLKKLRERETQKGKKDPLTHVFMREAALELVRNSLHGDAGEYYNCCLFLDIDNFKQINDTKGHMEGDRMLEQVGALLMNQVRKRDVIGRYGGDEFNLWLWNITEKEIALRAAERIVEAFRKLEGITVSIGVTMFTDPEEEPEEVLKRADKALYIAKKNGRDQAYLL